MNKFGHKKIFSVIFVVSLFIYMALALFSLKLILFNTSPETPTSAWNAEEEYPFRTETEESVVSNPTHSVSKITDVIGNLKTTIKNCVTSSNPLYTDIALFRKTVDRNMYGYNATTSLCGTTNDLNDPRDLVVLHESGFLSFVYDNTDINPPMEKIREFNQYLTNRGIDLLLFIPPYKDGKVDNSYRGVYRDYSSELLNGIEEKAQQDGVDVINFMDTEESKGLSEEQLYFRTDHHWLPQSGLRGCAAISPWLIERGYDIDTKRFEQQSYNISYARYPMLGSQGIKTTSAYTNIEYMPILEPLYSTDLTVTNPKAGTTLTGSIADTLYDYKVIQQPSLTSTRHFQFYSYGDPPLLRIHNNQRSDGKRILVIKDSFARVMVPYMCNMAEYVDVIDLRHFNGSLKTYMEENTPDSVIIVYAVGTFIDQSHYVNPSEYAFNFN